MKRKPKPQTGQKDLLGMSLADTLDQHVTPYSTSEEEGGHHDLYLLANAIDWDSLEESFTHLYSKNGHLNSRFGLGRCMLEGPVAASVNLKMAAAAWNFS